MENRFLSNSASFLKSNNGGSRSLEILNLSVLPYHQIKNYAEIVGTPLSTPCDYFNWLVS